MKNEINIWKLASLILLGISIDLGYCLYVKNNPSEVASIQTISGDLSLADYRSLSLNFKTDEVPDGENLYSMGGVLRIDGDYVDDQYFAVLFPKDSGTGLRVEISNDVNIKIFKDFNVSSGKIISPDLKTFRELTRSLAKDNKSWTVIYKIKIKNNLIENIEQEIL